ncbi:hypothetical protein L484_005765 [Morus notabilis]|uniref:Uncharacterized protein n=1 Tax=Morus notabilis TaxID=981085 RepID=W9S3I8_9ROSA|nr:hypothetical protein L484_005765 [Morus notabilis]
MSNRNPITTFKLSLSLELVTCVLSVWNGLDHREGGYAHIPDRVFKQVLPRAHASISGIDHACGQLLG